MLSRALAASIFSIALVTVLGATARATPLDKIDRTIQKQPAYKSSPRYCLLVFGPDAETKVWLVMDGDTLYIDRDADGDLTKARNRTPIARTGRADDTEQFFQPADVVASRDGSKHADVRVTRFRDLTLISVQFDAHHRQDAGVDPAGNLEFAATAKAAPVIHLGGPLVMRTNGNALHRGDTSLLYVMVGTPGVGSGTFASVPYLGYIPPALHPVAEVQIMEPGKALPVTQRVALEHRC